MLAALGFASVIGPLDDGTPTNSANMDTALVVGTGGDAWFVRTQALRGQSSATLTLYAYCSAVTGSPTFEMEVYTTSGTDAQRPATGGGISSSPNSVTPTASRWATFTCTVSMTQDTQYFILIKNTHADPANNHAAFRYRGALDSWFPVTVVGSQGAINTTGFTTDGFTTDPTVSSGAGGGPAFVLKYSDGTLQGNPYVTDDSAHANNQNDRGNRFTFTEDISVCGILSGAAGTVAVDELRVYTAAGASVINIATTVPGETNSGSGFTNPVTLTGGVAYDVVAGFAANSATGVIYTMGEAEADLPADVLACRPWSCAYVDGATPGSYTADPTKIVQGYGLFIDDFPAIAGGGGGGMRVIGG